MNFVQFDNRFINLDHVSDVVFEGDDREKMRAHIHYARPGGMLPQPCELIGKQAAALFEAMRRKSEDLSDLPLRDGREMEPAREIDPEEETEE